MSVPGFLPFAHSRSLAPAAREASRSPRHNSTCAKATSLHAGRPNVRSARPQNPYAQLREVPATNLPAPRHKNQRSQPPAADGSRRRADPCNPKRGLVPEVGDQKLASA